MGDTYDMNNFEQFLFHSWLKSFDFKVSGLTFVEVKTTR